jgi:hypothetical protein
VTRFVDGLDFWFTRTDRTGHAMWLALSLLVAAYGGSMALVEAFAGPHVIQDDARQHVVWALRYTDPEIFPSDPVADYFASVAPFGYAFVYRSAAAVGLDSILVSKLLPIVLGLVFAAYGYALGCRLVTAPAGGFLVSWTLTENAWLMDNLSSATPRAFLYPLFAAFLYYLLRRSGWGVAVTVLLLGLFYPQMALIAAGLSAIALVRFRRLVPRLTRDPAARRVAAFGVAAAILVLAPYVLKSGTYGPVISADAARKLPEFWFGQRAAFFDLDAWRFWTCGERGGLFPIEWCQLRDESLAGVPATTVPLAILILVIALPVYIHARSDGPVARRISNGINVLPRLLLVSLVFYVCAHILLFRLHLPNRYTEHSIRFAFDMAFGTCIYLLTLKSISWAKGRDWSVRAAGMTAIVLVVAMLAALPVVSMFVGERLYVVGRHPALYAYLRTTPKGTVVASLEGEGDNIPAFGRRAVLYAGEYGIPYHLGYYLPFRERGRRLAEAQYTTDPSLLRRFLRDFPVDYWLIDKRAFTARAINSAWWARQFPDAYAAAGRALAAGTPPVLLSLASSCAVLRDDQLVLISADCLRRRLGR